MVSAVTMDVTYKISNCDAHNLLYDVSVTSPISIVTFNLVCCWYRCVLVSQIICSVPNYCGVTIEHSECPKLFYCTFSLQNNEHDHRHSPTSKNNPRPGQDPLVDDWGECGFVAFRQQSHGLDVLITCHFTQSVGA